MSDEIYSECVVCFRDIEYGEDCQYCEKDGGVADDKLIESTIDALNSELQYWKESTESKGRMIERLNGKLESARGIMSALNDMSAYEVLNQLFRVNKWLKDNEGDNNDQERFIL